jgi:hypothetical protein
MYQGFVMDVARYSNPPPLRDTSGVIMLLSFGSAHAAGFQVVLCDGLVRMLPFTIDPTVFTYCCNRRDHELIDLSA